MSSGSIKNIGSGDELIKIANTTNFEEAFVKIAIGEEHERINQKNKYTNKKKF